MPRLPPRLLRAAHRISPHLATLLPACRDLPSATNELRWIREHALQLTTTTRQARPRRRRRRCRHRTASRPPKEADVDVDGEVARLCRRRARGAPLQYVLGSQPFGPLDIACRPGVLIPRPETEAWACWLADRVVARGDHDDAAPAGARLRVVDVCAGSGCIGLLLAALLCRRGWGRGLGLEVRGLDVEARAVRLARENRERNVRTGVLPRQGLGLEITFERADVFAEDWLDRIKGPAAAAAVGGGSGSERGRGRGSGERTADILVSNPPYISARGFARDTGRSVRNFEPRLALVPSATAGEYYGGEPEDVFYARLLDAAAALRPSMAAFEVGDLEQAARVAGMAARREGWDGEVEIWRDWPDMRPQEDEAGAVRVEGLGRDVPVRGSGNGRVVFIEWKV